VRLTRRGRLALTLSVAGLALVAAGTSYAVFKTPIGPALGLPTTPPCTLTAGQVTRSWTEEEAMTATTVAAVGQRIGATDNGIAAAVARALRGPSDRVVDAAVARDIYRGLPDRARPTAPALAVATALLGRNGPALTCTVSSSGLESGLAAEAPGASGLTARADAVRLDMRAVFAKQILGGFEPQGVSTGHIDGSAHYEGRAIDIFFRPINATNTGRGWVQAHWAVAHAERLHVATVIFDRNVWSARRSSSGWRAYAHPGGPTENPVLLHEDHVHVDVLEGAPQD
jgi:hypothetical protein